MKLESSLELDMASAIEKIIAIKGTHIIVDADHYNSLMVLLEEVTEYLWSVGFDQSIMPTKGGWVYFNNFNVKVQF